MEVLSSGVNSSFFNVHLSLRALNQTRKSTSRLSRTQKFDEENLSLRINMGRAKLKLELMSNSRSRRITFEKRKKGLMKKAEEFKILCGVDTSVIIYPMGMPGEGLVEPEIWPQDSKEVERVFCRYRSEAAERRAKHTSGLREFFASRKKKIHAELAEICKANWEAKYPVSDEFLKGLSEPQLSTHLSAVGNRLKQAKTRLAKMKEEKRRVEMAATSDWIVPSGGVDLHASNAGFMQDDGLVEARLPFEFVYQQWEQSMIVRYQLPLSSLSPEYSALSMKLRA